MIFYRSVIWHTCQDYCAVTMVGEIPLLDYFNLIFYHTGVGAQLYDLLSQTNCYIWKGLIFIRSRVGAHDPISTLIFCLP